DVIEFLLERFMAMDHKRACAAIAHARTMIGARPHWEGASSALFHLAQRLAQKNETKRQDRTRRVLEYLRCDFSASRFQNIAVQGQIAGLDLSGVVFEGCLFRDVDFRNCTFSSSTEFVKCRFDGNVAFENCTSPGSPKLIDCLLSVHAEREW